MGAATFSPVPARRDTLSGTLFLSILLHGLLLFIGIAYSNLGLHLGQGWGKNWGTTGAIHARAVSSIPGVPLPTPMTATLNIVATQNPGLYLSEPEPPTPPEPKPAEIPK